MKRSTIVLIIIILSCGVLHAQDTILLKDGSRLLVKIVDMDAKGVHYKQWTNPNGPMWVKSFEKIQSIRREQAEQLDFSSCGNGMTLADCLDGNSIVKHLDSTYTAESDILTAKKEMQRFMSSLPNCIQRKCVFRYFLNRYYSALDNNAAEEALRNGEIYLMIGGQDDIADVVKTIVLIHASMGKASSKDELLTNHWIGFLQQYSKETDDMFEGDINQLIKDALALLHTHRWEDEIKGKWVMLNRVDENKDEFETVYENPLILEIKDVNDGAGANMIVPNQTLPKQKGLIVPTSFYNQQLNTSQGFVFNGQANWAMLQFASIEVKDRRWLTDIVHTTLESNRKMAAELNATIISSTATIKEKSLAGLQVAIATGALNLLVSNMNNSSKTDEVYNVTLYPNTENVMNTMVTHVTATTRMHNSGITTTDYKDNIKNKKSYMVRWEESDSVIFISKNGMPAVDENDPLLYEYNSIRNQKIYQCPRCCIRWGVETALGAFFMYKGISKIIEASNIFSAYNFKEASPIYAKSMLYLIPGELFTLGSLAIPGSWKSSKRNAYMEINQRNIEKLRRKASTSLSMSPTYYPENSALGAAVNLSF